MWYWHKFASLAYLNYSACRANSRALVATVFLTWGLSAQLWVTEMGLWTLSMLHQKSCSEDCHMPTYELSSTISSAILPGSTELASALALLPAVLLCCNDQTARYHNPQYIHRCENLWPHECFVKFKLLCEINVAARIQMCQIQPCPALLFNSVYTDSFIWYSVSNRTAQSVQSLCYRLS